MDTKQTEQLLHAWMAMEVCIRGNRLLRDLSMNEMLVCSALYEQPMTATELCARTRLLKSQMNHILNSMEQQGLIVRTRSNADERSVCVQLREDAVPRYLREHERVLRIVGAVGKELGDDNTKTLTALMEQAARIVSSYKEEL